MYDNNFNNIQENIIDLKEQLEAEQIKVIPLKENSKEPLEKDYYNKNYTVDNLKKHNGNFGIVVGSNHKESSLAVIDIDGYKLNDANDDEYVKVKQQTCDIIFECLKDIPGAMHVKTQSGGYHIYLWNKTVFEKTHETSQRLHFPKDYEVEELAGKSLGSAIEIFTKDKSRQCL